MKNFRTASSLKYWLVFLLVIIIQLVMAWQVVVGVRESHLSQIKHDAEKDILFLSEIMREKLQNRDYLSADFFLQNWGESHCYRIDEITLEMANGFVLSKYKSSNRPLQNLSLTREIPYSYRGKAQLKVSVNLDSVCVHVSDCIRNMTLLILFFSSTLTLVLWFYLRQRKMACNLIVSEEIIATERERLMVTLRSIGDGVITTDIKGNVVLVNKVAEELSGWPQDEALGFPLSEVFVIMDEKTGELSPDPVTRVLAQQRGFTLPEQTTLISRDGRRRAIADSVAPIFDQESRIVGVVLVFRDVTEQEQLEKELLKNRKLESVALLAGGIAHDFNNILAAIMGNISLALTLVNESDEVYGILEESEKASNRARDLTQQLLTFSKGGEPVKKAASIENVLRDSASFVLSGTSVRCDFAFASDLESVLIDSGQISQVVQNLILNASQAMSSGGVIEIGCRNYLQEGKEIPALAAGKYLEIAIKDQGSGILPDIVEKIFDPYFTTKTQGSGLGLSITYSIINKHGGHIAVAARPGGGTTFTIYLPTTGERVEPEVAKSVVLQGPTTGRIMIMDDEKMIREMVEQMLSRFGYEVVLAADGKEALALYRQAQVSGDEIGLVIMDLTIPGGMGGKEAVIELKKIDPQARVIVSSGYSNDPIMANYKDYGFTAAMVKPFGLKDLKETVARVLA